MPHEPAHSLLLLRHAKSDWSDGALRDYDRPLSKRGREDAPRMGAWMRDRGLVPDAVVSSPAARARETTLLLAAALDVGEEDVLWDERVYGATVGTLLRVLEERLGPTGPILLVGHNPGLDELVGWLARERPGRTPSGKLLTTCALAHLEVPASEGGWTPGGSHLVGIYRPKDVLR